MDSNNLRTILVLLDLSAAFGPTVHPILLLALLAHSNLISVVRHNTFRSKLLNPSHLIQSLPAFPRVRPCVPFSSLYICFHLSILFHCYVDDAQLYFTSEAMGVVHDNARSYTAQINNVIPSCIDYWNSLLFGLPLKSLHELQLVQNSTARYCSWNPLHKLYLPGSSLTGSWSNTI